MPRGPVADRRRGRRPSAARLIAFGGRARRRRDRRRRRGSRGAGRRRPAFRATIEAAGFRPIEEIQPSRHRISPRARTGADEDGRLRRRRQVDPPADPDGRGDGRAGRPPRRARRGPAGPGRGSARRPRPRTSALDRFYDLLLETGERRHFTFGPRAGVRRLVAGGAGGRPPRLSRGARGDRRRAGRRADPVPPRRPAVDRPFGRPRRRPRGRTRARSTSCAGAPSSSRSARAAREMDLGGVDVAGARTRAGGGRSALRPVPAQAVVRRPVAGADRRPRARLRRRAATRDRAASPAGRAEMLGR